jgi:BirA family biotin operon repressor/biotin-[acetyl-CoA-carboxylase] ligase
MLSDFNIIRLTQTSSTNCYLNELSVKEKLPEGTIVITDNQTSGRGQASNKWESGISTNLTFSIILYPTFLEASAQFMLSKVISLAVYDFICQFVTNEVYVKWTNDIYVKNKKIAGILIENFMCGENLTKTIAGVGININQKHFESNAPNPISLHQITSEVYNLENCLDKVCKSIANRYNQLKNNPSEIDSDYLAHLYRFGTLGKYYADGEYFNATITAINKYGMLQLTTENHQQKYYGFKEVVFC